MSVFDQWLAYYAAEPFGEEREDYRAFMLAATVLKGLGGKDIKLADFTPKREKRRQTAAEMQAIILAAAGGKIRYVKP